MRPQKGMSDMKHERDEYRKLGIMLFVVLAAAILFYFIMLRLDNLSGTVGAMLTALQPVLTGSALAYILRPVQIKLERWLTGNGKRMKRGARSLSVFITVAVALSLISLFMLVVLPQLVDSVVSLVSILPGQLRRLLKQLEDFLQTNAEAALRVDQLLKSAETAITGWLQKDLMGSVLSIISNVLSVVTALVNVFLTVIVSIYVLMSWEHNIAQCKKLLFAFSRREDFNHTVLDVMAQVNKIFSGFITGKLIDSLIIGVLCFLVMTVLRMPYTVLISVIIGVTNIIPMFGPFIGAIPSAFLILLVSPNQCLSFVIFILILQQIDGNVIGPRILGNSTGLSALYVTIAMLLFSKLFGFLGMIVGVPVFATLYYLIKRLAEAQLRKRNLPTDTDHYVKPTETKKS